MYGCYSTQMLKPFDRNDIQMLLFKWMLFHATSKEACRERSKVIAPDTLTFKFLERMFQLSQKYNGNQTKVYLTSPEPSKTYHNLLIFHPISKFQNQWNPCV